MDKKSRDFVMGKLYLKNKDYRMAEKSFTEYLSVNPEDYQALKMLAQVQEQLNDTAKAFDLYQRCYLSQPDRSGVLLDLCRLLLFDDPHLEHVDKKKWLKLAEQAFPTNPIIKNLRESLPNGQDSHSGKVSLADMVMEKLTILEDLFRSFDDRLRTIEDMLRLREVQPPLVSELKTVNSPKAPLNVVSPPKAPESMIVKPSEVPEPKVVKSPEVPEPKVVNSATTPEPKVVNPPTAPEPKFVNPFGVPKQFTPPTESPFPAGVNLFESFKKLTLPNESVFSTQSTNKEEQKLTTGKLEGANLFAGGLNKFNPPTESPFSIKPTNKEEPKFMTGKLDGVNLFAESLKKFDIAQEGSWSTLPKPTNECEDGNVDGDNNDDDGVVPTEELPIENTCDMRPIEIKTGEEDEDVLFKQRCKLFRFREKEYKERGLGDIKVLKHRETGKGRLIMRREMINLVCLNCWSCQSIERVRDTQIRFAGLDASDGDAELTVFLAKFKTPELTDEFLKHLKDLFTE